MSEILEREAPYNEKEYTVDYTVTVKGSMAIQASPDSYLACGKEAVENYFKDSLVSIEEVNTYES